MVYSRMKGIILKDGMPKRSRRKQRKGKSGYYRKNTLKVSSGRLEGSLPSFPSKIRPYITAEMQRGLQIFLNLNLMRLRCS